MLYAVAAAAGALERRDFSNFSNCSLLSHLSAAGEAVQTPHALPATTRETNTVCKHCCKTSRFARKHKE